MAIIKTYIQPEVHRPNENDRKSFWGYNYREKSNPIELDYDTDTQILSMFDPNMETTMSGTREMWDALSDTVASISMIHSDDSFYGSADVGAWEELLHDVLSGFPENEKSQNEKNLLKTNENKLKELYGIIPEYNQIVTGKVKVHTYRFSGDDKDSHRVRFVLNKNQTDFLLAHHDNNDPQYASLGDNFEKSVAKSVASPVKIAMAKIYNTEDNPLHIEKIPDGFWPDGYAVDDQDNLVIRYKQIVPDNEITEASDAYVSESQVLEDKVWLSEKLLNLLRAKDMEPFVKSLQEKKEHLYRALPEGQENVEPDEINGRNVPHVENEKMANNGEHSIGN